jgi:hypothetical protein
MIPSRDHQTAQNLLSHRKADITQIYADRDINQALKMAVKIGNLLFWALGEREYNNNSATGFGAPWGLVNFDTFLSG